MKIIKTGQDQNTLIKELSLEISDTSDFALIEDGFDLEVDLINIVFTKNTLSKTKDLLNKSGYYSDHLDHLLGKLNGELNLVPIKHITYIEGINNDTYVHIKNEEYTVKEKLYELESKLYDKKFIRISKSYIVSINHIKKIKPTFNGKLVLILDDTTCLEVTRHYISDFRKYLGM